MTVLHQIMTNDGAQPKNKDDRFSTKIWQMTVLHQNLKMTVLHQNLWNDRAPPKNPNFLFSSTL